MIDAAIELSRDYCAGKIIDGSPALGHAMKVARKVDEHHPGASPDLIAAVILHDAPYFAPPEIDLDNVLAELFGPTVAQIVRAIEREHDALDHEESPTIVLDHSDVLIASAADKVVSIGAILRRAEQHPSPAAFWAARRPFADRVPYFHAFMTAAWPHLPNRLALELETVVSAAATAASRP
ncbi:HD domain-containing protein [Actinoplanes sp. NPDC049118]|uniref:HD domain-containing protein n=1 Tax=Actinoplanes sp. NPDC049118 TaxID=3155769 RepID=UPI0033F4432E